MYEPASIYCIKIFKPSEIASESQRYCLCFSNKKMCIMNCINLRHIFLTMSQNCDRLNLLSKSYHDSKENLPQKQEDLPQISRGV